MSDAADRIRQNIHDLAIMTPEAREHLARDVVEVLAENKTLRDQRRVTRALRDELTCAARRQATEDLRTERDRLALEVAEVLHDRDRLAEENARLRAEVERLEKVANALATYGQQVGEQRWDARFKLEAAEEVVEAARAMLDDALPESGVCTSAVARALERYDAGRE